MSFKLKSALLSLFFLISTSINPANQANAVDQVANFIDWNGINVGENNVGISQSITLLEIPSRGDANVDWSMNIGNSDSRLNPMFSLNNQNMAYFGFHDLSSDTTFSNYDAGTKCNLNQSNAFGNSSRNSANCGTPVNLVKGETYTFEITVSLTGLRVAVNGQLRVKSTGQLIKLATISFTTTQQVLMNSLRVEGFNQTSVYPNNGVNCQNVPRADVIYYPPTKLLNGVNPGFAGVRSSPVCPNLVPVKQSSGGYLAPFGSISSSSGNEFSCPVIEDKSPGSQQPNVTAFIFTGTSQKFVRFQDGTKNPVDNAAPLIGCYGDLSGISRGEDLGWQYGAINRDAQGYYWINGAGVRWRLTLDSGGLSMTTGTENPYYSSGNKFNLIGLITQNTILRTPRSKSSWSRPASLLPGLSDVRVKGYFANNTAYFTDTIEKTLITNTPSNRLPVWKDSTEMGTNVSIWWGGYFIPDESGYWDFQITSDDAAFMWLGGDAVSKYGLGFSTALIAIPDDHPPITSANSIYLEKNKIYPLRIQYGNLGGPAGTFKFAVKPPSYKSEWDTNLEGLIWYSDYSDRQDCTNYGVSYTLASRLGYGLSDVPGCVNNPAKAEIASTKPDANQIVDQINSELSNSTYFRSSVSRLEITNSSSKVRIKMTATADQNLNFSAFQPTDTTLYRSKLTPGSNVISFELSKTDLEKNNLLNFNFYIDDNKRVIILLKPSQFLSDSIQNNVKVYDLANLVTNSGSSSSSSNTTSGATNNVKNVTKPQTPTFKGFNVVGNTLNLNINVGTGSNKPDQVFLIAPQLGIDVASNNTVGLINNGIATWAIPISAGLLGAPLELKFFSVKNGVDSDNLITNINLPGANSSKPTTGNKSVPLPAIKPSYKNGALLINLTAQVQTKSGANPVGGYFVASVLGFTDTNPLIGRINKGVISFSIPLSPTLAGKIVSGQVYLTNEIGDSKPLKVSIKFPGASVVPAPTGKVSTVICKKGNQARTFVSKKCPPGWK